MSLFNERGVVPLDDQPLSDTPDEDLSEYATSGGLNLTRRRGESVRLRNHGDQHAVWGKQLQLRSLRRMQLTILEDGLVKSFMCLVDLRLALPPHTKVDPIVKTIFRSQ